MEGNEIQVLIFQQIKTKLPPHLSLTDEVAELLDISTDAAFRRIRGEINISAEETRKLALHYKISVDQLLKLKTEGGTFTGKYITADNFDFEKYLQQMLAELKFIASFKQKELTFLSKDIPPFLHFAFPELAAFKYFFWMKTILQFPQFAHTAFNFDLLMKPLIDIGNQVMGVYNSIPCTEIMSIENINTTLRQVEYYKETYIFSSPQDLEIIYLQLHEMTDYLEGMAEAGLKSMPKQKPGDDPAGYKLYVNDFIIGDNSFVVTVDGNRISYIVHNHLNFMTITDPGFTSYHYNFVQNVIRKSILISEVGEKYRARFFHIIHDRIEQARNNKMPTIGKQ